MSDVKIYQKKPAKRRRLQAIGVQVSQHTHTLSLAPPKPPKQTQPKPPVFNVPVVTFHGGSGTQKKRKAPSQEVSPPTSPILPLEHLYERTLPVEDVQFLLQPDPKRDQLVETVADDVVNDILGDTVRSIQPK